MLIISRFSYIRHQEQIDRVEELFKVHRSIKATEWSFKPFRIKCLAASMLLSREHRGALHREKLFDPVNLFIWHGPFPSSLFRF